VTVSAVIPVFRGTAFLQQGLAALQDSTVRPDEVIVVIDGPADGSVEVAEAAGARVVRLDEDEPQGPAVARNAGAAIATGDLVLFLDVDVRVHPDTVRLVAEHFATHPGDAAVFGSYDAAPPDPLFTSRFKNLMHHFVHQQGRRDAATFWAGCGAIRREVFRSVGGFDERYRRPSIEDIELGVRLRAAGYAVALRPDIQVTHLKRWTLTGLVRSDIFDRAVPWTRLILQQGRVPRDLNLSIAQRASAIAAWVLVGSLVAAPFVPWALWLAAGAAVGCGLLNWRLGAFMYRTGGFGFAVRAGLMFVLYLLYSSAVFGALLVYDRRPRGDGWRRTGMPAALLCIAALAWAADPAGQGPQTVEPLADPIPNDPVMARFGLVVTEVATFPVSEPSPAPTDERLMRRARINYLGEIPDGSGRRYVPDLNGMLYLVDGEAVQPYFDLKAAVGPRFFSGRGLGSGFGFVAFHPEFGANGIFYTVHTETGDALTSVTPDLTSPSRTDVHGVLTEWTTDSPGANRFVGTRREVLRLGFGTYIHGIQQIDFNPTAEPGDEDYGLLYLAVGDGGLGASSREPQNLAVPHGKILRIDPSGRTSANGHYGIPASNPFVGRSGALGEIYAYGVRDPHRFSWDPLEPHRMFLAQIGEKNVEAIYDVHAGDNFGWSEREGPFVRNRADPCHLYPLPADEATFGYTLPVVAYDHDPPPGYQCGADVGHAVGGGFVYRGAAVPDLRGKYLFTDIVDGRVMYAESADMRRDGPLATIHELTLFDDSGREVTAPMLAGDERVDLRFGRDAAGELYLLAKANGTVWKVVGTRDVSPSSDVFPSLVPNLAVHYDFEHPGPDAAIEVDQGFSGTNLRLINGGSAMRVGDGALVSSETSLQLRQLNPDQAGNDDWKAGVYSDAGVSSLHAFSAVGGATVMGWFKLTATGPALNSTTTDPDDRYNAIGLAGLLTGDSDGHSVRALLELIRVDGTLRLVALGRRVDGGDSRTFAADEDWERLLPIGEWVFLAATFDFSDDTMALYRNGRPIPGFYTDGNDRDRAGDAESPVSSPTDPRGIKIGGSFPQNTSERNPCDCRVDSVMFLDRALSRLEVNQQYRRATSAR